MLVKPRLFSCVWTAAHVLALDTGQQDGGGAAGYVTVTVPPLAMLEPLPGFVLITSPCATLASVSLCMVGTRPAALI